MAQYPFLWLNFKHGQGTITRLVKQINLTTSERLKMIIIDGIQQGSPEWHKLRCGVVTSSRFSAVLAKGQGKTRATYMVELAAEILTGQPQDCFTSKYMEHGVETEDQARAMYELKNDVDVREVTLVYLDARKTVSSSTDGLVGGKGMIEIKCPKTTTQIDRFLKGKFPTTYAAQVQGGLYVTGREWCDFVSFDPRIDADAGWFQVRVYRDEEYIKNLDDEINRFMDDLANMLYKLGKKQQTA